MDHLRPPPATAASQAATVCPAGYLCLQPSASSARTVLVKQGDSRSFSGGLQVSQVSNQTGAGEPAGGTSDCSSGVAAR